MAIRASAFHLKDSLGFTSNSKMLRSLSSSITKTLDSVGPAVSKVLNAFVDDAQPRSSRDREGINDGILSAASIAVKANICAEGWSASAGSMMLRGQYTSSPLDLGLEPHRCPKS